MKINSKRLNLVPTSTRKLSLSGRLWPMDIYLLVYKLSNNRDFMGEGGA
jgi:hypothetical protein